MDETVIAWTGLVQNVFSWSGCLLVDADAALLVANTQAWSADLLVSLTSEGLTVTNGL